MTTPDESPAWRRSQRCDTNACIEVAHSATGGVALRDSTSPDGPYLRFPVDDWARFITAVRTEQP